MGAHTLGFQCLLESAEATTASQFSLEKEESGKEKPPSMGPEPKGKKKKSVATELDISVSPFLQDTRTLEGAQVQVCYSKG